MPAFRCWRTPVFGGAVLGFLRWYRAYEKLTGVLAAFAACIILLMALWITYDVITRNLFGMASPWAFDLSEYGLVWMTFLAAPWVLLKDRHVRIELLVDALPVRYQRVFGVVVSAIAFLTCSILAWRCGIAASDYYTGGDMMPRIWRIPRILAYAVVPIGSFLLAIACVFRLGLYLTARDPEDELKARAMQGQSSGLESKIGNTS